MLYYVGLNEWNTSIIFEPVDNNFPYSFEMVSDTIKNRMLKHKTNNKFILIRYGFFVEIRTHNDISIIKRMQHKILSYLIKNKGSLFYNLIQYFVKINILYDTTLNNTIHYQVLYPLEVQEMLSGTLFSDYVKRCTRNDDDGYGYGCNDVSIKFMVKDRLK